MTHRVHPLGVSGSFLHCFIPVTLPLPSFPSLNTIHGAYCRVDWVGWGRVRWGKEHLGSKSNSLIEYILIMLPRNKRNSLLWSPAPALADQ